MMFLQSQSPQGRLQSQSPQGRANATDPTIESQMGGLGIDGFPIPHPSPAYDNNMLKDHIWDDDDEDEDAEVVY